VAALLFAPQNTLFVSPVWPAGVDPSIYFTTVAGALAQAPMEFSGAKGATESISADNTEKRFQNYFSSS
jgi:hypothetical protein